ncbi:zinc finger, C2H2, partial [Tanacetum coccineum]
MSRKLCFTFCATEFRSEFLGRLSPVSLHLRECLTTLASLIANPKLNQHGHQVHICHRCGWPFPNSHPSSKHMKAHKKACGTIEGYTKLIHSDPLSDDDEEENTP